PGAQEAELCLAQVGVAGIAGERGTRITEPGPASPTPHSGNLLDVRPEPWSARLPMPCSLTLEPPRCYAERDADQLVSADGGRSHVRIQDRRCTRVRRGRVAARSGRAGGRRSATAQLGERATDDLRRGDG